MITDLKKYTCMPEDGVPAHYQDRIYTCVVNVSPVTPFLQYRLMDEDGVNCFASSESIQWLLKQAQRRSAYESKLPTDWETALVGYTFSRRVSADSKFVEHLVLSPDLRVFGVGILKDEACAMALKQHYANTYAAQIPLEDFRKIAVPVGLTRRSGKYVFDNQYSSQQKLRNLLSLVWQFDSSVHDVSLIAPNKYATSDKDLFLRKRESEVLFDDVVQKGVKNGVLHVDFAIGGEFQGNVNLVFFDASMLNSSQAIDGVHEVAVQLSRANELARQRA